MKSLQKVSAELDMQSARMTRTNNEGYSLALRLVCCAF